MSLVGTLAKVAIGVAIAKGMQSMSQKSNTSAKDAGTGGLFGGAHSPNPANGTGLEDMMGSILGGKSGQTQPDQTTNASAGQAGGLGGLLEQLAGGAQGGGAQSGQAGGLGDLLGGLLGGAGGAAGSQNAQAGGGLGDLLGGLLGGAGGATAGGAAGQGGLGDLLGGLLGGAAAGGAPSNNRSFGDVLNASLSNKGEPDVTPTAEQNAVAALMLRAMIQADKADGKIDDAEKQKLLGNLTDATAEEMAFVKREMARPVDIEGLANSVPNGLQAQVYTMSVMAINLDNQQEAQYLHSLAQALGIDKQAVNHIHGKLGVPALYA